CLFLFIAGAAFSQQPGYSSGNQAAIRIYDQAMRFYDNHQNDKAMSALQSALEKDSLFIEAYLLRATIYEDQSKFDKAIADYKKAMSINPELYPKVYLLIGKAECRLEKYEDAKADFEKFIS